MKKRVFGIVIASVLCLSGCGNSSGVSQEDYDALKKQLEEAQSAIADASQTAAETVEEAAEPAVEEEPASGTNNTGNSVTLKQSVNEETGEPEEDKKEVELINCWNTCTTREGSDYSHINYVVEIKNPNENYDVLWPTIQFVAKAADGSILASKDLTLSGIAAGDTIIYGNEEQYEGPVADSVEITVSSQTDRCYPHDDSYVKQEVFEFNNASEQGERSKKITGELTNNSDTDFSSVAVCVLYSKDGEYVGGKAGYVHDVRAGSTNIFEVSGNSYIEDYDSIDLYAIQW